MPLPVSTVNVLLLPPGSGLREEVSRLVESAGPDLKLLDPDQPVLSAHLVVVDGLATGGYAALRKLRLEPAGPEVIALLDLSRSDAAAVEALEGAEFMDRGALSRELVPRLRQSERRRRRAAEARRRERDLSLLLRLTGDYAESLDPREVLHDVTRTLAEELQIERASLVVLDEQGGAGFIVAASDDPTLKDLRIQLSSYPEIREVVRTGKPVIVEDVPTHPLLEGRRVTVKGKEIHAIAALPLAVQGKVLGVLLVRAAGHRAAFSGREIDFLATVAHSTAVALRNARMLEAFRGQTEREKHARIAAEERAESLKRYESYFANLSDGVAIVDDGATVLTLNPAGAQMLDVTVTQARGQSIHELTSPSDETLVEEVLASVRRGEVRRNIDLAIRTPGGRRLTLSVSAAPLEKWGASCIVSFRDVTAQRQLEGELRHTKDFLEKLIDSSVDAIIAADMGGRILLYNKGAEAICGFTAEEAISSVNVRDLYPPGVAADVMTKLRAPDHGGRGRLSAVRQSIVNKQGERVPVNMTASILYEGDQEVATVGIFTDLRDRVQLERKLSDAETRLEESEKNAVIVALAGTAAHELNQPLTSVMGYAELLRRRLNEGDFAFKPVDIIYREAERMAEIVRKIGKITRYETKAYVGSAKILDLDKASSHED